MRAPMIAVLVMWVTATAVAQQTNTLDAYRQTYEKHAQSILAQYGKDLDTVSTDLKKKGDLDNILLLQTEKKRFDVEKSVPAPKESQDAFRAATEVYCQAMVALLGQYVKALDGLVKTEVASDRIKEAQGVKMEKDKASILLADMQTKLPVKAADAITKTAAPTSAISVRSVIKPKTYVDETRGAAGIAEDHNVYTFNVEQVGQRATLRFWAGGAMGNMTYGRVTLKAPEEDGQLVYKWQPKDFKIAANAVESYKELKPITCDVSKHVKKPGPYEVKFKWTDGPAGLHILKVELDIK